MPGKKLQQQRRHRLLRAPQELHLRVSGLREENRRARALLEPTGHPVVVGMVVSEHDLFHVLEGNPLLLQHLQP
ncbi:hypothetical protein D3C85_1625300 [compost metagenome]